MYRITVETEDGNEYELQKVFRSRTAAEDELDDILDPWKIRNIDGSQIINGHIDKE